VTTKPNKREEKKRRHYLFPRTRITRKVHVPATLGR
jgi:hypothetical protein